jgi:hypothetical protein
MRALTLLALAAPLGLLVTGSEELDARAGAEPACSLGAAGSAELHVAVHTGSRLLHREGGRLELRRGSALPCSAALAQQLQAELARAASALPIELLPRPLRVHVDPRLPAREAPLAGIEVHVSSRELLVARSALPELPEQAWRHELLHVLAAAPPEASEVARRLWLTLEEGLVQYATERSFGSAAAAPAALQAPMAPPAPPWEQLALPAYDPHELAHGWASELRHSAPPLELVDAVACASARPSAPVHTLQQAALSFARRCPANVAPVLQEALQRWLPEEWQPQPEPQAAPGSAAFFLEAR